MAKRTLTDEERARLMGWLEKAEHTVYTDVKHVSRSGMNRSIAAYVIVDGEPLNISGLAAKAIGCTLDTDRFAVKVSGCGMDMGFELVYSLSYVLWPKGYGCDGPGCWSNDHSNGDRDYTPHGLWNDTGMEHENREPYPGEKADGCHNHWHADGGYRLRQRWL